MSDTLQINHYRVKEEHEGDVGEEGEEEEEAVRGSGEWERKETMHQDGHGRCLLTLLLLVSLKKVFQIRRNNVSRSHVALRYISFYLMNVFTS